MVEIDGVFSGGGIKGFALIGAYQAIEAKGFRFKRLAGTSAGSLIASLIAAGFSSEELTKIIEGLDLRKFLDERKIWIPYGLAKWILLYWRMGLYKGEELERWLENVLRQKGVGTFGDLPKDSLYIIASDLSNGRMMIIPDDLKKYGFEPSAFSVAKAVRMSVSIPYFFEPVKLRTNDGKLLIVDGGILSNFPLFLFDEEKEIKKRPVLGVQLSSKLEKKPKREITNAIELYEALFATMREAHDARYISRRHEKNIVFLPVKNTLTTEFTITEEEKNQLIEYGRKRTEQFLKTWTY
jgi:NTE family protein